MPIHSRDTQARDTQESPRSASVARDSRQRRTAREFTGRPVGLALIAAALCAPPAAGQFGSAQELVPPPASVLPTSYEAVRGADLDADGDLDVYVDVILGMSTAATRSYANLGGNTLALEQLVPSGELVDMDGDGDADVVAAQGKLVFWFENTGSGGFGPQLVISEFSVPFRTYLGARPEDVDGDGDVDVLTWWSEPFGIDSILYKSGFYENSGDANFVLVPVYDGWKVDQMRSGDVDGDGDGDVAIRIHYICFLPSCSWPTLITQLRWAENLGDGGFGPHLLSTEAALGQPQASAIDLVDLDGDGDLDLRDGHGWLENLGGGQFGPAQLLSTDVVGGGIAPVEFGDLDRDGALDFLSSSPSRIDWYRNLGNGTFDLPVVISGTEANGVDAVDWDGDGDLDVLASRDDALVWFENTTPAVDAAQVVRVGVPANPAALLPDAQGGPLLGQVWSPVVDHTTFLPGAMLDFLVLGTTAVNVPTPLGTFLCTPTLLLLQGPASTAFTISIPSAPFLAGAGLCFQGAALDLALPIDRAVKLTNALDVTIGNP